MSNLAMSGKMEISTYDNAISIVLDDDACRPATLRVFNLAVDQRLEPLSESHGRHQQRVDAGTRAKTAINELLRD